MEDKKIWKPSEHEDYKGLVKVEDAEGRVAIIKLGGKKDENRDLHTDI